jgi:hypothetical protein
MNQTYSVELPCLKEDGTKRGDTFITFADPVLEAIFSDYQQLDAVGDSRSLAERLAHLNKIIEPFGFEVKKK